MMDDRSPWLDPRNYKPIPHADEPLLSYQWIGITRYYLFIFGAIACLLFMDKIAF